VLYCSYRNMFKLLCWLNNC